MQTTQIFPWVGKPALEEAMLFHKHDNKLFFRIDRNTSVGNWTVTLETCVNHQAVDAYEDMQGGRDFGCDLGSAICICFFPRQHFE